MKKWTNRKMPGALHFVTANVINRRSIFKQEKYCLAFLKELQKLRAERKCRVIAFVLMPDHVHFIANPRDGDIQTATGSLKSLTAKSIIELDAHKAFLTGNENQVWQESFRALPLWSDWMIRQKINYIHANPVKANLCETAANYRWTSFRAFYRDEADPLMAIDKDWWWPGDEQTIVKSVRDFEDERQSKLLQARIQENKVRRAGASRPS